MELKIVIDKNRAEEVLVFAHERSELVKSIESLVERCEKNFVAYGDGCVRKISADEVYCFVSCGGKVYALTENEKLLLKERLYQIEEKLGNNFVKINQSCIGNINSIKSFDVSVSGTLKVIFKNGYTDYVSRRQIKNVKERFGI
ncbi:MAG: LytTR family transcriptional regulator [Clostridia bacterium]|nr:LytTR family transcriptional regulator [Clostridia bacterium]